MRYTAYIFLLSTFVCTIFSSCKKGCTNPTALNYNDSAKEDDASCLFCDSAVLDIYDTYDTRKDDNSSSPYYEDEVIRMLVQGELMAYAGNNCKQVGLVSVCNSQNNVQSFAYVELVFENKVGDTLIVNGNVSLNLSGAASADRYEKHIVNLQNSSAQ